MSTLILNQTIDVTIDRLSYGEGAGVARYNDFVVFIANSAPQDRVKARITGLKKNYALAEIEEIINPSPHRTKPPCQYSSECGGCSWQHIQYDEQLTQKELILKRELGQLGGDFIFKPFVRSPNDLHYRNRIQIHTLKDKWGFKKKKSNQIIFVKDCLIAKNSLVTYLKQHLPPSKPKPQRLEISENTSGVVQLYKKRPHDLNLFSQVNTEINDLLIREIQQLITSLKPNFIIDAYCGSGNLSIPLAETFSKIQIHGIELSKHSVALAKTQTTNIKNIHFTSSDVELHLKNLKTLEPKTVIIVDPPRAGCSKETLAHVLRLKPLAIIYLSCKLSTLKRDLTLLTAQSAYVIKSAQGYDMFPQTPHFEVLTLLTKGSSTL